MDKRKNLRNLDSLAYDYVSVLLNWKTAASLSTTPTFTVSKVLGGTFPFNADMLSFTPADSSSTISFTFASPFDINTSPWQFELELTFTTSISKFRPTAVYNGSNNQITIKFNVGSLTANTSYPVVFTAKRYRPTTQYLEQLATAAQLPVTVSATPNSIVSLNYPSSTSSAAPATSVLGHTFTAPNSFTITQIKAIDIAAPYSVKIVKIFAPLPTTTHTVLYQVFNQAPSVILNPNIQINTNESICIFHCYGSPTNVSKTSPTLTYTLNFGGVSATVSEVRANTTTGTNDITQSFTNFFAIGAPPSLSDITITTAGGTAWSNIIY